jgi:hypothetical protein
MFALVAVSMLVVGLFVVTDLAARASRNRERAARAMHIAEAGLAHALGAARDSLRGVNLTNILRGGDNVVGGVDDSLLWGHVKMLPTDWIPASGTAVTGGRYFVTLFDDPGDPNPAPLTDGNDRIIVRCRGITDDGGEAQIEAMIGSLLLPGIATDGNLEISGKPTMVGACGGIHANGNLFGGGQPVVSTVASASGQVTVSVNPQIDAAPSILIPDMLPTDHMTQCDYTVNVGTGTYEITSSSAQGTWCVTGNVKLGDMGSASSPRFISVIATGSIEISGKPFIKADHSDEILLLAGGDFSFSGDWEGGDDEWAGEGLLYAGGHCYISSKPKITGQVVCKSKADPPGAKDLTDSNLISGDATITYTCGSVLGKRRIFSWYPVFGS